jgi:hypothetical protein
MTLLVGRLPGLLFAEIGWIDVGGLVEIHNAPVESFLHVFVIRRPRPILQPLDQTVLDRIIVDVIHMSVKIALVMDPVLPESSLPDSGLALSFA